MIYNGIDAEEYTPDRGTDVLEKYGVDPGRPSVVFVGRITRQKGVPYLVEAALEFDPAAQLVLCAGAPDTPEIAADVEQRVERLRRERGNVIWLDQMLPKREVIQLLSHATVFACPSIYEPLGIVNLEAMACEAAVVATATGGIVEVVVDGETGLLVPFETAEGSIEPRDPAGFVAGIAERVNALVADPARAAAMGRAGRERAVREFDWSRDRARRPPSSTAQWRRPAARRVHRAVMKRGLGLVVAAVLWLPAEAAAQDLGISRVTRGPGSGLDERFTQMVLSSADGTRAVFVSSEDIMGEGGEPGLQLLRPRRRHDDAAGDLRRQRSALPLAGVRGVGRRHADRVPQLRALDGRRHRRAAGRVHGRGRASSSASRSGRPAGTRSTSTPRRSACPATARGSCSSPPRT